MVAWKGETAVAEETWEFEACSIHGQEVVQAVGCRAATHQFVL